MKAERTLEFVWRGSASLPANQSEIFCHVYESYYCMPVPTYAFEWGPARGAVIPDARLRRGFFVILPQPFSVVW